jgi:hypothetical protein
VPREDAACSGRWGRDGARVTSSKDLKDPLEAQWLETQSPSIS